MNVLFISPNSPFESIGGIERYILNLINYFKLQKDIKTFLILPTTEKSHKIEEGNMTIYYDESLSISRTDKTSKTINRKSQSFFDLVDKIIPKIKSM